ncbi:MAG: uroporphyrinogen decarboxylase family protein, partial [Pseudomonadota bacterium]
MDHKQRIRAVLAGEPPDQLPVATWGHDFLREWSAAELAAHTIERQRKYNYDFVKLNPRWTLFAEPWGNQYARPVEQKFPRLTRRIVETAQDLHDVPQVASSHPILQEHVEAMRLVVDELGNEVDVLATVFAPLAVVGLLCGGVGEPLRTYAQTEGAALHQVLTDVAGTLAGHVTDLLQAGASGVFYAPLQWTSLDVCDAAFYAEFGRPYD